MSYTVYREVRAFVNEYNKHRTKVVSACQILCIDESMVLWTGRGDEWTDGMPHVTHCPCKPEPLGLEIKNMCVVEGDCKIMLHL